MNKEVEKSLRALDFFMQTIILQNEQNQIKDNLKKINDFLKKSQSQKSFGKFREILLTSILMWIDSIWKTEGCRLEAQYLFNQIKSMCKDLPCLLVRKLDMELNGNKMKEVKIEEENDDLMSRIDLDFLENVNKKQQKEVPAGFMVLNGELKIIAMDPIAKKLLEIPNGNRSNYPHFLKIQPLYSRLRTQHKIKKMIRSNFKKENRSFRFVVYSKKKINPGKNTRNPKIPLKKNLQTDNLMFIRNFRMYMEESCISFIGSFNFAHIKNIKEEIIDIKMEKLMEEQFVNKVMTSLLGDSKYRRDIANIDDVCTIVRFRKSKNKSLMTQILQDEPRNYIKDFIDQMSD